MSDLNIAILGDVHGHLTLSYRLLKRWEREHDETISAILQVGDLGAYPPPLKLDKATTRFAKKDPDELGFVHYHEGSPEADAILGQDAPDEHRVDADLYFIKGNHDDFDFLAGLDTADGPAPVDHYHRIHFVAGGSVNQLRLGDRVLRVGALGGIRPPSPTSDPVSPFYTKADLRRLRARGSDLDILLTHDSPHGTVYERAGSPEIRDFLLDFEPRFHFCGHYHLEGRKLDVDGPTRSYLLNEVNFHGSARLNRKCFGILRWGDATGPEFDFIDDDWLAEYTRANYRWK